MFFRSIRFKVMLWYMLFLMITLFLFSLSLYGGFTKILYGDLDDLLSSRTEGVVNAINTYWNTRGNMMHQNNPEMENFIRSAGNWMEEKRNDPELMSLFVRILDEKGTAIIASRSMPHLEPLPKDVMDDIMDGEDSFDTLKGETVAGKRMKFRIYTKPVMENNVVKFIVQVAGPISLLSLASQNLIWVLFVLLPLTVLLAGIPGVLLVRLTLRPVDTMIKTLRQTTAENLKLKIHIPDTKDEIKRLAETFNEMTERLDKSFSSQQNFIQDTSSELKVPIAVLKKKFESALGGTLPLKECDSLLKDGLKEMEKFEKILSELETLARFDNRGIALEIRKVDLSRLLEEVLKEMRPRADQRHVTASSFLQDIIVVDGDEKQLKQLFVNLIDNAIKFTYRKGKVTVTAHKDKKFAIVSVSDTGLGIEENELAYIFDRFYQINKSRRSNGSFGLGLSIAKSAAEVHKGTIAVESKLGTGTTFTVSLPLRYSG